MNVFAIVCDSDTLPEDSSFFMHVGHPFPTVCIRTITESLEAFERGCFARSGIEEKGQLQAVNIAVKMVENGDNGIRVPDC